MNFLFSKTWLIKAKMDLRFLVFEERLSPCQCLGKEDLVIKKGKANTSGISTIKFHLDCMNSWKYKRDPNCPPRLYLLHVNENYPVGKTSNPGYFDCFGCFY